MKLLLSSLLFASLCALSSWSVSLSGTLVVTQTPDLSVMEGETLNITCCWKGEFGRVRIHWLENRTNQIINQTNQTDIFFKNHSQGSLLKETSDCSNLTFTNITREASGRYTCRVSMEIPTFTVVKGNGTVLTVKNRDNPKPNTEGGSSSNSLPIPIIVSLAVVALLLLITLVCFCTLRRRQAQAARVIYEIPHTDSEEAEMDKHSTSSSRGSSQWCQVPVYESFDYFERVETKESG